MAGKRRGVAYCRSPECARYAKTERFLDLPASYFCPDCGLPGSIECERGTRRGGSELFHEIRIEYGFDAERGIYRSRLCLRDGRLLAAQNVYTLQTPLARTRDEARRIGTQALRALNRGILRRRSRRRIPSREQLIDQGWPVLV